MRCLETGKSICLHFSGRNCDKKRHWSLSWSHFRISFVYPSSLSLFGTLADLAYFRDGAEWSMTSCQYPTPPPERDRMYQHKVSLVVRYFMIPCNICLILLATSTLGFAVLLFLNNCRSQLVKHDLQRMYIYVCLCVRVCAWPRRVFVAW